MMVTEGDVYMGLGVIDVLIRYHNMSDKDYSSPYKYDSNSSFRMVH